MYRHLFLVIVLVLLCVTVCGSPGWSIYAVRVSDLTRTPVPPNPMRVWGRVTSDSPLKINDGCAEITVTGMTATIGEFLVIDGSWNGQFFSVFPIEMVLIPAGSFLMGNSGVGNDLVYDKQYGLPNEKPQHSVYLKDYHIGKHEVTRAEYRAFMDAGGYENSSYWSNEGWSWRVTNSRTQPYLWSAVQSWGTPPGEFTQTDNYPVVGVSYYECEAFCTWAGGHLPTEAQWEKAARWTGSHPNVYPWGDEWVPNNCNNWYDTLFPGFQTAPQGSYPDGASPYGCQDMAGNALEWCKDWYSDTYYAESPAAEPQGPATGTYRVLHGGCLVETGHGNRCAYREYDVPADYGYITGFRLAR